MAATNFTPIILYHTTTASAAPTAGNLNNGELAININDGKLFYKDSGGTVQVIATKGTGTIGGSNTQVQYNSSGALAGSANFTFNGTTATINTLNLTNALGTAYGGTALTTYTQGDLVYASAANTLAKLSIGANTYILTSTGSVPQWSAPSAVTVATANNLAGGAAGSVPYQSGASTTTFLSIGTQNQVLTSTGSAPQWSSGLTLTTLATTGNTTLGDAAADNLTVNATITSNLIFTDNTYDIGASGATRPRNLYLAGLLTMGGALTVNGNTTLGDASNDTLTINGTAVSIPNGLNFDSDLLVLDATNNYVGINRSTPIYPLDVNGIIRAAFPNPDVNGIILQATTVTNAAAAQIINGAGNFYYGLDTSTGNRLLGAGSTGGYQGVINVESNYPLILAQNNTGRFYLLSSGAVFNETGADYDFRVESDGNTHMLFVDAGTDTVNIGGTPPTYPGKLNVGGGGIFSNATNFDPDLADNGTILLGNIDDGGGFSAPGIGWKNSGTGNTAAVVAAGNTLYLGTGDASTANSLTARLNLSHLESVFNEGGLDVDFRVESDTNTHALFVDAGVSKVGFNYSTPSNILHAGVATPAALGTSSDGLVIQTASGTGYNTQLVRLGANYNYSGATGAPTVGAAMLYNFGGRFFFVGDGASASDFVFTTYGANRLQIGSDSYALVVNEDGLDYDFRVESDTYTHALFVDAGNSRIGVNQSAPETQLHIGNTSTTTSQMTLAGEYQGSGYTNSNIFNFQHGGNVRARMRSQQVSAASDNFILDFDMVNGSVSGFNNFLRLRGTASDTGGEVVVNDGGLAEIDFRVESDNNTHALFVDAGNSRVGINNSSPAATLSVTGVPRITSPNFSFATVDKEVDSSTGIVDFTFAETTGSGTSDNLTAVVIISIYQPSTSTSNEAAGYVGLRLIPRGGSGTLVQIASQQGSGISTFTVAVNGDGIRVTTDTSPTLRCRLITLGGGGTSVPSE